MPYRGTGFYPGLDGHDGGGVGIADLQRKGRDESRDVEQSLWTRMCTHTHTHGARLLCSPPSS